MIISLLIISSLYLEQCGAKNVLILLSDDGGLELPVYGNNLIKTPNLDQLASSSAIFTKAFTSVSSCSPSRSAILTGLPTHQNGMYGLHQGYHHFNSFSKVRSLPNILSRNSIRTGIIGKKHIGPKSVYRFDYEQTEENNSIMQVGRNITNIKLLVREFLNTVEGSESFFLYIGFHDPHRCGHTHPEYGQFCEKFGDGTPGMGLIPDWNPIRYDKSDIHVPYFVQNTNKARMDIASQYTTISRLDQGIGLVLEELHVVGKLNDTLIIYSSDNGIPFPSGRTNSYDPGIIEPLLISNPHVRTNGKRIHSLVSHLDLTPTVLDWFNITYPKYYMNTKLQPVTLTGKSLLPLLNDVSSDNYVFVSHTLHEATMYYPMRAIRTGRYKLIHNINYNMPFPIDQDFYISKTFQDLLVRTLYEKPLHWYKTLDQYYHRSEWELFDLKVDPKEMRNVATDLNYLHVLEYLRNRLFEWQKFTNDPWRCSPHAVLQDSGVFKNNPRCFPLFNMDNSDINITKYTTYDNEILL